MTQKNKTIILVIVAVAIWGYTIIEWFTYIKEPEATTSVNQAPITTYPKEFYSTELNYEVQLDYQDPFLKSKRAIKASIRPTVKNQIKNGPTKTPEIKNHQTESIPPNNSKKFEYNGYIQKNGVKYSILKVGSNSHILKEGEKSSGVIVKTIYENKIIVIVGSAEKSIEKN